MCKGLATGEIYYQRGSRTGAPSRRKKRACMPFSLRPAAGGNLPSRQDTRADLLVFVGIGACVLAAYLPAVVHGSWVFDDLKFLFHAPRLETLEGLKRIWLDPSYDPNDLTHPLPNWEPHYWPLLYTTFWIERQLLGDFHAPGFRATNLAIHLANVWLLWTLLRRFNVPGAWCIALVWAIHPGQMAAPALILHRKDVLAATFVLAAVLICIPQGRPRADLPWSRVAVTSALVIAGALVKTTAALLPVFVAIVYWWRGGPLARPALVRLGVLLAVGLVTGLSLLLLMRELSPLPFATFTLAERACIAALSLSLHLFFSVVPFPGVMRFWFWDEPASLWWAWCAVGAAAAGAVGVLCSLRSSRHVAAAAAWLAIALVPYLGFMDHHGLALSIAWPRHRYLASIAPLALVIGLAFHWVPRVWTAPLRCSAVTAVAPVLLLCFVVTVGQSLVFTRPSAWTGYQLRYDPDLLGVQLWHVRALLMEGDSDGALAGARQGVSRFPDSAQARASLALMHAVRQERAQAAGHYARALAIVEADPDRIIAWNVPGPRLPVNRERVSPAFVFHLHAVSAMLASCDGDGAHAARHRDAAAELFPEVSITSYLHPEDPHRCPVPPTG